MAETTFHSITLPGANPARVPLTAVEFSTSTVYKVRDYCTYQGKLYICSTAHAAGAWNAAHFTEVNVGDEINTRLVVPPTTEPASTNRRVGDLWIDTNTESPVISVDPQPIAGSTNVPQSGGTFNLIKNLDNNKAGKSLLTGNFDPTKPYSVDQLCIHDGYLYRCIVDIPTGTTWNASKWQATTIADELARVESEEVDLDVIAETFGDSSSYAVGDYVLHTTNGVDKLYRCTSAVSDTSVWNSQYWSEVKLADEVGDLKSALNVITAVTPITNFNTRHGYNTTGTTIDINSPVSSSVIDCTYAACSPGDKFTYTGKGSNSYRPYAFIKSDGTIIKIGPNHTGTETVVISAPANAAYVVFNMNNAVGRPYSVYKGVLTEKQDKLTFDTEPTQGSANPVTSGGVYNDSRKTNDNLTSLEKTINIIPLTFTVGKGYNTTGTTIGINSPTTNNAVACSYSECSPGDKFTYRGFGTNSYRSYAFLDSSGNIISDLPIAGLKELIIIAPDGAAYVIFNSSIAYNYFACKGAIPTYNADFSRFPYKGKTVAIIGDSISTNGNWSTTNPLGNVPEIIVQSEDIGKQLSAYVTWLDVYTNNDGTTLTGKTIGGHTFTPAEIGSEVTFTPVSGDEGKTVGKPYNNNPASDDIWWEVVSRIFGFTPIPVAWSGSSITSHEGDKGTYKTSYAWHDAQIRKCGVRVPGSITRTAPDMVIIFRGTNDLTHTPYPRITDYMGSFPNGYPDTDVFDNDGATAYDFAKGMLLTIKKVREAYPSTKIVLCTLNYFRRLSSDGYYDNNGIDSWQKYNAEIRNIAHQQGCDLIEFDKDGLTWANAKDGYYNEGTAENAHWTHPNTNGHKILANRAIQDMLRINSLV